MSEMLYRRRWWIWGGFLLAWTVALQAPIPPTTSWTLSDLEIKPKVFFAKGLHLSAYVALTALSAWLRAPIRYRVWLIFLLMGHATATELLQSILEPYFGRNGNLYDVALDQIGIGLGILLAWRWWTQDIV
jgi:VanZ family protein